MRVLVVGDCRRETKVLLDTTEATALMLMNPDGSPSTIFQLLPDGSGWVRYTSKEDRNFAEVAAQLGLS